MLDILKAVIALSVVCWLFGCTQKKVAPTKSKATFINSNQSPMMVDSEIYKKITFIDNSRVPTPYLSMNIAFDPVADVRKDVEKREKLTLSHRGEAHITVLTPPEFEQLKSALTMELINEVALLNRIQETPFEIICLGRGQRVENKKTLSTYFIVVEAPGLVMLRHTLASLYKTRGGGSTDFDPDAFTPHITVGFTDRDLHVQDGVLKNKSSCLIEMQLKAQ